MSSHDGDDRTEYCNLHVFHYGYRDGYGALEFLVLYYPTELIRVETWPRPWEHWNIDEPWSENGIARQLTVLRSD